MIKEIKLWYYRHFKIITLKQCYDFSLFFKSNIYGDEINYLNCRSIWKDNKGRLYRCKELINNSKLLKSKKENIINLLILMFFKFNNRYIKLNLIQDIEESIFYLQRYNIDCSNEIKELNKLKQLI